jgi:hypothetical protein
MTWYTFAWHYNSKYEIGVLAMVYWSPYTWYFDPPTHGNLTPLPAVY